MPALSGSLPGPVAGASDIPQIPSHASLPRKRSVMSPRTAACNQCRRPPCRADERRAEVSLRPQGLDLPARPAVRRPARGDSHPSDRLPPRPRIAAAARARQPRRTVGDPARSPGGRRRAQRDPVAPGARVRILLRVPLRPHLHQPPHRGQRQLQPARRRRTFQLRGELPHLPDAAGKDPRRPDAGGVGAERGRPRRRRHHAAVGKPQVRLSTARSPQRGAKATCGRPTPAQRARP